MKSLEDLIQHSPEIGMKHYDRSMASEEAKQQQDLAAKEASYIQAVGYVPTPNISAQDWEDQVHRNKRSTGTYIQSPNPYRSGSMY